MGLFRPVLFCVKGLRKKGPQLKTRVKKVVPESYIEVQKDTVDHRITPIQEILDRAEIYDKETYKRGLQPGEKPIPVSPILRPIEMRNVKSGKKISWCSCGMSLTQPICDNSHKGTMFKPHIVTIEQDTQALYLCGCKLTNKAPFCDGATCVKLRQTE